MVTVHPLRASESLATARLVARLVAHRKIPKISPEGYILQRPFLRGFHSEGLMYGGKFAFQNRLG